MDILEKFSHIWPNAPLYYILKLIWKKFRILTLPNAYGNQGYKCNGIPVQVLYLFWISEQDYYGPLTQMMSQFKLPKPFVILVMINYYINRA